MRRALDRRLRCLEQRKLSEHWPTLVLAIYGRDEADVIGLRPGVCAGNASDAPMIQRLPGESIDALEARAKAAVPAGQFAAFMTVYRPEDVGNVAPLMSKLEAVRVLHTDPQTLRNHRRNSDEN